MTVRSLTQAKAEAEEVLRDRVWTTKRANQLARDVLRLAPIAEAAHKFERAYQQSLGSASAHDIALRDEAQTELREALAGLDR